MDEGISYDDLLKLAIEVSIENAERSLDDATLLINNSSFGHVFALTILALEETAKAIYCNWALNRFVNADEKIFKNIKTHRAKQRVIKEVEKLIVLETDKKDIKNQNKRKALESRQEFDFFIAKLENSPKFKSIESRYGMLEKMKYLALYVNVNEYGGPSDPSMFTRDVCILFLILWKYFLKYEEHISQKSVNNTLLSPSRQ